MTTFTDDEIREAVRLAEVLTKNPDVRDFVALRITEVMQLQWAAQEYLRMRDFDARIRITSVKIFDEDGNEKT